MKDGSTCGYSPQNAQRFFRKYGLRSVGPTEVNITSQEEWKKMITKIAISDEITEGDVIYMLSDGFPDQLGKDRSKKFTTKRMKDLFIKYHLLPMEEQKVKFETELDEWMGEESQIDDILLIGIKLK